MLLLPRPIALAKQGGAYHIYVGTYMDIALQWVRQALPNTKATKLISIDDETSIYIVIRDIALTAKKQVSRCASIFRENHSIFKIHH